MSIIAHRAEITHRTDIVKELIYYGNENIIFREKDLKGDITNNIVMPRAFIEAFLEMIKI